CERGDREAGAGQQQAAGEGGAEADQGGLLAGMRHGGAPLGTDAPALRLAGVGGEGRSRRPSAPWGDRVMGPASGGPVGPSPVGECGRARIKRGLAAAPGDCAGRAGGWAGNWTAGDPAAAQVATLVSSRFSRGGRASSPWTRNQMFSAMLVAWSPTRSRFLAMNSRWVHGVI